MRISMVVWVLVACGAVPVAADMIPIEPPPRSEASQLEILASIYGGEFEAVGEDFLGGGPTGDVNAIRFDDVLTPMGIVNLSDPPLRGEVADAFWADGAFTAVAVARYAGHSQRFGFDRGDGFELLFDVSGRGVDVSGEAVMDLSGESWSWVRSKINGSNTWYSDPARNSDGLDHMVTYRITGLDTGETVWLLFWEDLPSYDSDLDYNDLAVEIRAVPEPTTAAVVLLGCGGFLLRHRRRRRRERCDSAQ